MTSVSAIYCCITTVLRLTKLKQPPFIKAHEFIGQVGGSADVGKSQPILTKFALRSVSTGKVAGGWCVYTHMLGSWRAGSWGNAWNWATCFSSSKLAWACSHGRGPSGSAEAQAWKWHTMTSTVLCWPKQVTSSIFMQGLKEHGCQRCFNNSGYFCNLL